MNTPSFSSIPQTGLTGLLENWRSDLQAGFLVFLIALGVSLVSRLSGSHLTINGSAAGLIVVIFNAEQAFGEGDAMAGYRYTLAAIMAAGMLQVVMGRFRIGQLSSFFPASVVHGMLAILAIELVRGVGLRNLFKIHFTIQRQHDDTLVVKLLGSARFSNFLPKKKALAELEPGKTIIFDFTDGYLIDHTVMECIHDFRRNYEDRGGHCRKVGKALETFSDHALAARLTTADDRD